MAELYPLRAHGDWAGTKCHIGKCTNYARFVVGPIDESNGRRGVCAVHLAATVRSQQLIFTKAVVVQEVPGNWGRELIVVDDNLARLANAG